MWYLTTCKEYCCCQGIFVEGRRVWTTQPISYTPHSRGLVDQISKGSSKYQDILVRMHDTTISSIKKLVLVCLVTIMKWLVTLDADLPAVVSLMTSTPSSLSQTWSSYRFCRLEQHDNKQEEKLIRIYCQYSPKFPNLGCRMLMVHHPSCSYWCTGSGWKGMIGSLFATAPSFTQYHTTPSPLQKTTMIITWMKKTGMIVTMIEKYLFINPLMVNDKRQENKANLSWILKYFSSLYEGFPPPAMNILIFAIPLGPEREQCSETYMKWPPPYCRTRKSNISLPNAISCQDGKSIT